MKLGHRSTALLAIVAVCLVDIVTFALPAGAARFDAVVGDIALASTSTGGAKSDGVSSFSAVSADGTKVAFSTTAKNLDPADHDNNSDVYVKDLTTGTLTLVSASSAGVKGNGPSFGPSISADGTKVAFQSRATSLDPHDFDATLDIYVKDLTTGALTLVSTSTGGVKGNRDSALPSISGDGSAVAFQSEALNLSALDTDLNSDVYVKNLTTGTLLLASTSSAGVKGNGVSQFDTSRASSLLSTDGTRVVFASTSTNLDSDDPDALSDIYLKDLTSGTTTLVSQTGNGVKNNGTSLHPSLSGDGSAVAFSTNATDLDPNDSDTFPDVYVKNALSGRLTLASSSDSGVKGNDLSSLPSISRDGSTVAFMSAASNLQPADTDHTTDIYIKDLVSGEIMLVSTSDTNIKSDGPSETPATSSDGTVVSFESSATNLDPGDHDTHHDIYVKTIGTPVAPTAADDSYSTPFETPLTVSAPGVLINDSDPDGDPLQAMLDVSPAHGTLSLSPDGSFTYTPEHGFSGTDSFKYLVTDGALQSRSAAVNLTIGDAPPPAGQIDLVSTSDHDAVKGNDDSYAAVQTSDSHYVAFLSYATNFDPADTDPIADVYVKNLVTRDIQLASINAQGDKLNAIAFDFPALSDDGHEVAFATYADNLDPLDTDSTPDIYVKNLNTGELTLASTSTNGVKGNGESRYPSLSKDGRYLVFMSTATNLDPLDTDASEDIYLKDLSTGVLTLVSAKGNVKGNGLNVAPHISQDGTKVLFDSLSTNLVTGDTDPIRDVYVKDLTTGQFTLVSVNASGVKGNDGSEYASFSPNGRYVSFESGATNLDPRDTDPVLDVYLKDLSTGTLSLAGISETGDNVNGETRNGAPSDTGRVGLYTYANNLDPIDPDQTPDSFVQDLSTGDVIVVDSSAAGVKGNDFSLHCELTPDGTKAVFFSKASNLHPSDTDHAYDVYVKTLGPSTPLAPHAADDSYNAKQDVTLNVPAPGVLTNDYDPAGKPLTAAVVTTPVHGTVTLQANGSFSYAPTPGYSGTDTLTYTVNNGTLTSAPATVTIVVEPIIYIAIENVKKTEGNSGTKQFKFDVYLFDASASTVTVHFATADNSAVAGSDYIAKSGTVSFAPGQTVKKVTILVIGDHTHESNEKFLVQLSNSVNAVIADATGVGTIKNDD